MSGYVAIGLDRPKTPANVGSVLRAAHCYGAGLVVIGGNRIRPGCTDTTKAYRHIPMQYHPDVMDGIPYDCQPVVIELCDGAHDLRKFVHPRTAFYIFGPEDGSVRNAILDRVKHRVMIPTRYCMNLAATVNVVLYDRLAKESA